MAMQVAGPSGGVSSCPLGQLPGRPRQNMQLAKRGFELFFFEYILITRVVTKFITPVCWSRTCLVRHVQINIQNLYSRLVMADLLETSWVISLS